MATSSGEMRGQGRRPVMQHVGLAHDYLCPGQEARGEFVTLRTGQDVLT